ncbi:FecR family protein [Hephaestia caeni]|uniref:FecR family protein n=1 Tax=Hephaestia caeni TaxID=645617 RepID=A0A397PI02_9SPHN|nr:FecR domain-containing protein [Hephaestia caeni]RIA46777.1 FecR family protein [Hephaestia caeni]
MSDENWPDDIQPTPLMEQATSLISDLDENPSPENFTALKAWYEASVDHRRTFASAMFSSVMEESTRRRIEETLGREFEVMPNLPGAGADETRATATSPRAQPWGPRRSPMGARPSVGGRRRRLVLIGVVAAASAAVLVLAVGLTSVSLFSPIATPANAQTFETGHAQIRSFSLSDGSAMTLDADTRVEVTIDRKHRQALLRQGRARFIVKPDSRPFTIEAANGKVLSGQGTVDVQVDKARQADVRLRAGSASLQVEGRDAKPLVVDQPIVFSAASARPTPVVAPPDDTRDWPSGWVEYRTIALGALVTQANRYAKTPIILDDPSLASLQASGRFKLTDTENFAKRIAEPFGLRVSRRGDGIHLSR